ncbi:hypothetical protein MMC34_004390 [Xylographa carneopallida]|nr:hypothetical protein [Xylographa carneopallida]
MCDFELIVYRCKHTDHRRFAWCHHARNEPGHICSGVKALKRVWPAEEDCDRCVQQREALAHQQQLQLQQQHYQQQQQYHQQQQQGGGMPYPGYQGYRQ